MGLGALAGAAGVAGIASALTHFAKSSLEAADALGDAADRAGVAVESLSRLKFAAEQNDVDFSSLTFALKRWQVTLSQAASGSEQASASLRLLHLNAAQLKSLSLEDQLKKIADQFTRIRDPADQTRVAVELFGRSGEQLVPLLRQGGAAIDDLTKKADELGITLSESAAKGADLADKALKRLLATISAAGQKAAGNIALAIIGPQNDIDKASATIDKLIAQQEMLKESAKSAGADAPAWFKRLNADAMAKVNAQLEKARANLAGLQKQAEESKAPPLVIPDTSPITEAVISQHKNELQGLAKLLDEFNRNTRVSEDKFLQEYHDTLAQIDELTQAHVITQQEASKRIRDARLKYEQAVDIELIDVNKIEAQKVVVTKVFTEQQRAVDKFVATVQDGLENLARSGEITGRSILKYLLSSFEAQVLKDAIDGIGRYLRHSLGGSTSTGTSGAGSIIGSIIGSLFGSGSGGNGEISPVVITQKHAAGGGSMSGPRVVGEDGPELLFDSGRVMNRRQLQFAMAGAGGGANISLGDTNIVVQGNADANTIALLRAEQQQNNKKLLEQLNLKLKETYGRGIR